MKPALKITLVYLALGIFWILLSDRLLLLIFKQESYNQISTFQTAKGLFYVTLTAALLYVMVSRHYRIMEMRLKQLESLNGKLSERQEKLTQTNENLEKFAFVASHDMLEPLRMITGFMSQLRRKYAVSLDDKGRQYIDFALDGAEKMRQLILNLLNYSRAGHPLEDREMLAVSDVVSEVRRLLHRSLTEARAKIVVVEMPPVYAFRSDLIQLFSNMISNAVKYTSPNSYPEIRIEGNPEGRFVHIRVSDNGIGIAPEEHLRIFTMFHRLHNNEVYNGTGMGLAICKKIVEQLGGSIWVESQPGEGATFHFTLPAYTAAE